jgi:hypothetical protein
VPIPDAEERVTVVSSSIVHAIAGGEPVPAIVQLKAMTGQAGEQKPACHINAVFTEAF